MAATQNTSVDDRFSFAKPIGEGGYGTAWSAVDSVTGRKVVLKEMSKLTTTRSDFKRELQYSKYLGKHQNIITTHSAAYETHESYVMIQDYAVGGDLFDAIEPEVGLEEKTAKAYLSQICQAVAFMHNINLVHRDIKPENIVLSDKEGSLVQLIDFGMTLKVGTHVPVVAGSIPYIAPEMYRAHEDDGFFVDPSADVWSVGILLFCMLTGSFPWEQATLCDTNYYEFIQWQGGVTTFPPPAWCMFSPELLSLFNKMLAIKPEERCSITEVVKYLNLKWF